MRLGISAQNAADEKNINSHASEPHMRIIEKAIAVGAACVLPPESSHGKETQCVVVSHNTSIRKLLLSSLSSGTVQHEVVAENHHVSCAEIVGLRCVASGFILAVCRMVDAVIMLLDTELREVDKVSLRDGEDNTRLCTPMQSLCPYEKMICISEVSPDGRLVSIFTHEAHLHVLRIGSEDDHPSLISVHRIALEPILSPVRTSQGGANSYAMRPRESISLCVLSSCFARAASGYELVLLIEEEGYTNVDFACCAFSVDIEKDGSLRVGARGQGGGGGAHAGSETNILQASSQNALWTLRNLHPTTMVVFGMRSKDAAQHDTTSGVAIISSQYVSVIATTTVIDSVPPSECLLLSMCVRVRCVCDTPAPLCVT